MVQNQSLNLLDHWHRGPVKPGLQAQKTPPWPSGLHCPLIQGLEVAHGFPQARSNR